SNLRFPKAVRAFHRLFRHAGDTREVRSARRNVVHPAMVGTGIRSRGGDERPTNDRGEGRWAVRGVGGSASHRHPRSTVMAIGKPAADSPRRGDHTTD